MLRLVVVSLILCGCDRVFGLDGRPDAGGGDAAVVSGCFGKYNGGLLEICFDGSIPSELRVLAPMEIDTTDACTLVVSQADGSEVCVIAAREIAIDGTLSPRGPRPLVLVAIDTLTVSGSIDAASHSIGPKVGPAAHPSACSATITGGSSGTGGSGGAGGSFATLGGNGGTNQSGQQTLPSGVVPNLAIVRAGCHGGDGGSGASPSQGGSKGLGGGAVYLIAGTRLVVKGTINASGSGALGASNGASGAGGGGGGGGSGGLIGLDSPSIELLTATLIANGGGGSGSGGRPGNSATNGRDPDPAFPTSAASGGLGAFAGGGGGGLGFAIFANATEGNNSESGGGGGGGGGYIKIYTPALSNQNSSISPAFGI